MVVMGDFCQLPPVLPKKKPDSDEEHPDYTILRAFYKRTYIGLGMAFEGYMWKQCRFFPVVLSESVRQKDPEFIEKLNLARMGDISCLPYFNSRCLEKKPGVHLLARNEDVHRENLEFMQMIPSSIYEFETRVTKTSEYADAEFEQMITTDIPETLRIKEGADIIVTANDYSGAFAEDVDELREGSRHRHRDVLYYNGLRGTVLSIDAENTKEDQGALVVNLENGRQILLYRQRFNIYRYEVTENGDIIREVIGFFEQFPILPAYALTVHRAQGQTLSHVRISPDSINSGQLYVALSRSTTVEGISLDRKIQPQDLKLDPMVTRFYEDLDLEIAGKLPKKQGRPPKTEGGTVKRWIPAQLEHHIRKECVTLQKRKIYKIAKFKPERIQMRIPVEIVEYVDQQVKEWKKVAKAKLKETTEGKKQKGKKR